MVKYIAYLICGVVVGTLGTVLVFRTTPQVQCLGRCDEIVTQERLYFSDELLVYSPNVQGSPLLLRLDLNRKRVSKTFTHYYYADISFKNTHQQLYTTFTNSSREVQSSNFLTSFSTTPAADLSARETYDFSFAYKNININATSSELRGDFLVKNTPEYTKYVSEGVGEITLDGQKFPVRIALAKSYSSDYNKYVYFNGYDTLKSLSQAFALWDSEENFYFIDTSNVAEEIPDYKSHTWVLYKNKAGNFSRKAFAIQNNPTVKNGIPQQWSTTLPDIGNSKLSIKPYNFITSNKDSGIVQGTITTPTGTLRIGGYFIYHQYGD